MNRIELNQSIISKNQFSRYMEIGTFKGSSFFPIRCAKKIAIDPHFQFSLRDKIKWIFRNPYNWRNRYFQMTSDDFFVKKTEFLARAGKQELIFIDGLHTFRASLKDVLNSLQFLSTEGVIVMHDCYPPNEAAAEPGLSYDQVKAKKLPGWTGEWCGDVWKTIHYLRELYPENLEVHVLNSDYGLGIIKFRENVPVKFEINEKLYHEIDLMNFDRLKFGIPSIIGLQEIDNFNFQM